MSDVQYDEIIPIGLGDLSGQEDASNDVIPAATNVVFSIKKPKLKDKLNKDKEYLFTQLDVQFVVSGLGVDGEGKYKNKHFFTWKNLPFPGLLLSYNNERYTNDWWKKNARYQLKQFLAALGYDPKTPPQIDKAFLESIDGREIVANITKEEASAKNEEGVYVKTGEMVNYLRDFIAIG